MGECNCIADINEKLKEYNAAIMVNLFGPPRATVTTYTEKKIRGKRTPIVMASFCPFCGMQYADSKRKASSDA